MIGIPEHGETQSLELMPEEEDVVSEIKLICNECGYEVDIEETRKQEKMVLKDFPTNRK